MSTSNNLKLDPGLYSFLDSCLFDKGIKDVPEDLKNQMILDLSDRLQTWLMQSVFKHIKEEDVPGLDALLEKQAEQEKIMQFLGDKIPNISQIFEEEMLKFKQAYLGLNKIE